MAQKNKKQSRKTPRTEAVVESVNSAVGAAGRSYTTDFNPDYSQTIKDLRRIAILAGGFFVVLIALALIMP